MAIVPSIPTIADAINAKNASHHVVLNTTFIVQTYANTETIKFKICMPKKTGMLGYIVRATVVISANTAFTTNTKIPPPMTVMIAFTKVALYILTNLHPKYKNNAEMSIDITIAPIIIPNANPPITAIIPPKDSPVSPIISPITLS